MQHFPKTSANEVITCHACHPPGQNFKTLGIPGQTMKVGFYTLWGLFNIATVAMGVISYTTQQQAGQNS